MLYHAHCTCCIPTDLQLSHFDAGYFDAPATQLAALGGPEEGLKSELPLVTLVFCAISGLKPMRVNAHMLVGFAG